MRVWRALWWCGFGVCTVFGAVMAVAMLSPAALVGLTLSTVVPGFVLAVATGPQGTDAGHRTPEPSLRHLVSVIALVITAVVSVVGLVQLAGPAALLLVGVLAATSSWSLHTLTDLTPHHRAAQAPTGPAGTPPQQGAGADTPGAPLPSWWTHPPHTLSDPELCQLWRASYPALHRADTPTRTLQLVHIRSALLDELAARHPDGFAHWMQHGARAASNPTPYITTHTHESPTPGTTG
jgi:hypothetical protein